MNNDQMVAIEFLEEEIKKELLDVIKKRQTERYIEVSEYVIGTLAWKDMTIYERFYKVSGVRNNKAEICKYVRERIFKSLKNDYRRWFEETINGLEDKWGMHIGLSQKLINMSIKYFYFIELGYEIKLITDVSFEKYEKEMDIPIDSYILKWLIYNLIDDNELVNDAEKITAWTKMQDKEIYNMLQRKAKGLLEKEYPKRSSSLLAETEVWKKIKEIKSKVKMEV